MNNFGKEAVIAYRYDNDLEFFRKLKYCQDELCGMGQLIESKVCDLGTTDNSGEK